MHCDTIEAMRRNGQGMGYGFVPFDGEGGGVDVEVDRRGFTVCDQGRDGRCCGATTNNETPAETFQLLVKCIEMCEELIATDLSCRVYQSGLEDEQGNDLVMSRRCGCPRGVVVEAKVSPEPHHARSWIGTVHGPSMKCARTNNVFGPDVFGWDRDRAWLWPVSSLTSAIRNQRLRPHRAPGNKSGQMRGVMTIIYIDEGMQIKRAENTFQQNDHASFCPQTLAGGPAAGPLNPVLYTTKS